MGMGEWRELRWDGWELWHIKVMHLDSCSRGEGYVRTSHSWLAIVVIGPCDHLLTHKASTFYVNQFQSRALHRASGLLAGP